MESAGYRVRESDPFETEVSVGPLGPRAPAFVRRLEAMWASMRETVVEVFPPRPGLPRDRGAYLRRVDDLYERDAYHSLSIEGYEVTEELIHRVSTGEWDPEDDESDRADRDALAARGYWQGFQSVTKALEDVLAGENPGTVVRNAHRDWYRDLFQPFVVAGVLEAPSLAGYRSGPVYIKDSRHVPPDREVVRDALPVLFDLLEEEEEPSVGAVLGHWMFGYIHPFRDGNGRLARFLMNVVLASGGYPLTVIRVEDRAEYMAALESASVETNIRPFAEFVAERVEWSKAELEGWTSRRDHLSSEIGGASVRIGSPAHFFAPPVSRRLRTRSFNVNVTNMNSEESSRPYRMTARAEAAAQTARDILDATAELWHRRALDQITLEAIADEAGVSVQTVLRKFNSKKGVFDACIEREAAAIRAERNRAPVGDVGAALDILLTHYERDGDAVVRTLRLEDRLDAARTAARTGRKVHREWCARVFAPFLPSSGCDGYRSRLDAFVAATDVYLWKLLRRDLKRSRVETRAALENLLDGLVRAGGEQP